MPTSRTRIAMKIKTILSDLLELVPDDQKLKLSAYVSEKLNYEYNYLSNVFSEEEGTSIEKYFIQIKIDKVKKLIDAQELTLTEVAYQMGYSSPAHLTNQFKSVTGMTPSCYRSLRKSNHKKDKK